MVLEQQIQSLIFSLVFGMLYALMYNLFYKQLFKGKLIVRIIFNLLFTITNTTLYFFVLTLINNGIIHLYFLIMLSVGSVIGNISTRKIRRHDLEYL